MATDRTCLNTKKLMCEPTRRHGIFVPPPQQQQKARCFIQGYYKGYGSNTHGYAASGIMNDNVVTTAIMEYEELEE